MVVLYNLNLFYFRIQNIIKANIIFLYLNKVTNFVFWLKSLFLINLRIATLILKVIFKEVSNLKITLIYSIFNFVLIARL